MRALEIIFDAALNISRPLKRFIQITVDSLIIFLALCMAMASRLENLSFFLVSDFYITFILTLVPTISIFHHFGLYRAFLRHVSTEVAVTVAFGSLVSAFCIFAIKVLFDSSIPLTVPLIYSAFLFIAVAGTRFILRGIFRTSIRGKRKKIAVYGGGETGARILQALRSSFDYSTSLIIDDNTTIQGESLFGHRIYSFDDALPRLKSLGIDTVLFAMPDASRYQRNNIISRLIEIGMDVKIIPSLSKWIDGTSELPELKNVAIEDLIGREAVEPKTNLMNAAIKGRVVLVSGAGGSIGSELCKQIIDWQPQRLVVLDQSEYAIYLLTQEMEARNVTVPITPVIMTIMDKGSVLSVLKRFNVDIIYHAAAYKHVPLMEQNVIQAIKNNVFGTKTLAECAIETGVKSFVQISTDKAVNPTNYMGKSKRLSELMCQNLNESQSTTCFSIVRFGNVLGSSGSVIQLFKKQIENGGPITVTHKDVSRYFMTIPEAAQLVIQAGAIAKGGEVFVLDMGEPVKILDLAKSMVRFSALTLSANEDNAGRNIEIEFIGLRPGEKMFEQLSYSTDLVKSVHERILIAKEVAQFPGKLDDLLTKLTECMGNHDEECFLRILDKYWLELIPSPQN